MTKKQYKEFRCKSSFDVKIRITHKSKKTTKKNDKIAKKT